MPMTQKQFEQELTNSIKELIDISKNKKEFVLTFESEQEIKKWGENYIKLAESVKEIEKLIAKYKGYEWYSKVKGHDGYDSLGYPNHSKATLFWNLSNLGTRMASYLQQWNKPDTKEAWIDVLMPAWKNVLQLVVDITCGAKKEWDEKGYDIGNQYQFIQPMFDAVRNVGIKVKA